jgi:hypothetical protein
MLPRLFHLKLFKYDFQSSANAYIKHIPQLKALNYSQILKHMSIEYSVLLSWHFLIDFELFI